MRSGDLAFIAIVFFSACCGFMLATIILPMEAPVVVEKETYVLADTSLIEAIDRQTNAIHVQTDGITNLHNDMTRWHLEQLEIDRNRFQNYINH